MDRNFDRGRFLTVINVNLVLNKRQTITAQVTENYTSEFRVITRFVVYVHIWYCLPLIPIAPPTKPPAIVPFINSVLPRY